MFGAKALKDDNRRIRDFGVYESAPSSRSGVVGGDVVFVDCTLKLLSRLRGGIRESHWIKGKN